MGKNILIYKNNQSKIIYNVKKIKLEQETHDFNYWFPEELAFTSLSIQNNGVYSSSSINGFNFITVSIMTPLQKLFNKTITNYTGSETKIKKGIFQNCSKLQVIDLPNCSYIGIDTFLYCSSLQSVNLPNCSYIESCAFESCYLLQSINLPNCSYIESSAFYDCFSLYSINLPNCSYIGDEAFAYCSSLQSINLSNCSYVGNLAFYSCYLLQSVNLLNCSDIGHDAFYYCTSLQFVNLPNCSLIERYAFAYCSSLQSINLLNCSYIGANAFRGCLSLSKIILGYSSIVTVMSTTFNISPIVNSNFLGYYGSIYVPASLVDSYKTAGGSWSYFSDRITSIPE